MIPAAGERRGWWYDAAMLLLLAGLLASVRLASAPLAEPDEARSAIVARLMLGRGDWLAPHLPAVFRDRLPGDPVEEDLMAYWDKPPLYFWLVAGAMSALGPADVTARLPSALAFLAAVLLVWDTARRAWGRRAGILAGLVLALSPLAVALAHVARMEELLMALMAAMLAAALRLLTDRPGSLLWVVVLYGCGALGVLTKGPEAIVLPAVAVAGTLLASRRWRDLGALRPLLGCALLVALAAPWFLAMHLRYPGGPGDAGYLHSFFLDQNLGRALTAEYGQTHFPGYLALAFLAGTLPWAFFVPGLLRWSWRQLWGRPARQRSPFLLLPLIWILVVVGLFSLSSTQLAHYVLPAVPALALLMGGYLATTGRDRLVDLGVIATAVLAAVVAVGVPLVLVHLERWRAVDLLFVLPLAALAAGMLVALRTGRRQLAISGAGALAAGVLLFAVLADPTGALEARSTRIEARLLAARLAPADRVLAFPRPQYTFYWYLWLPHPTAPNAPAAGVAAAAADPPGQPVAPPRTFVLLERNRRCNEILQRSGPSLRVLSRRRNFALVEVEPAANGRPDFTAGELTLATSETATSPAEPSDSHPRQSLSPPGAFVTVEPPPSR